MKTETILQIIAALDSEIAIYKPVRGSSRESISIWNSLCDLRQSIVDNLDARGIKYNSSNL